MGTTAPPTQPTETDPGNGCGCSTAVAVLLTCGMGVLLVCGTAMALFDKTERDEPLDVGGAVCGLSVLGLGIVGVAALHRR